MTTKVKALCVGTRCANVDEFVASFHRYCDADSFFVATLTMRPVGLETPFAIQLADKTPILRGMCVVREAWLSEDNPFGRPGIWLGIRRLTRDSTEVFSKLRARRVSAPPLVTLPMPAPKPPPLPAAFAKPKPIATPPVKPRAITPAVATSAAGEIADRDDDSVTVPEASAHEPVRANASTDAVTVVRAESDRPPTITEVETRVPGSDYVLPANPLMNLTDESLEGFVDCTLYEGTGQFLLDEMTPFPRPLASLPPIDPPLPSVGVEAMAPDPSTPPAYVMPESGFVVDQQGYVRAPTIPPFNVPAEPVVMTRPPLGTGQVLPIAKPSGIEPSFAPPDPVIAPPAPVAAIAPPPIEPVAAIATFAPITPPVFEPIPPESVAPSVMPVRAPVATPRAGVRWWAIAIPVGIAVAVIAVVVITRSSASAADDAPAATAAPVAMKTERVAVANPPPSEAKVVEPPPTKPRAAVIEAAQPPGEEGPPVVGKGPCRLSIAATPAGSQIAVDGEAIGPAPLVLDTTCAQHRIDLAHPRYAAAFRMVSPVAGKPETIDVTLKRPTHSLKVTTQPANATVSIDGRRAGTSPTVVSITGFQSIAITVTKPGYDTVTKRVYSKQANDGVFIKMPATALFFKGGKK